MADTTAQHESGTPTSCSFPGHPGTTGHVNACQLCPTSPTYWRGRADSGTQPCRYGAATAKTTGTAEVKP